MLNNIANSFIGIRALKVVFIAYYLGEKWLSWLKIDVLKIEKTLIACHKICNINSKLFYRMLPIWFSWYLENFKIFDLKILGKKNKEAILLSFNDKYTTIYNERKKNSFHYIQ